MNIDNLDKKLREVQFFLSKMREEERYIRRRDKEKGNIISSPGGGA
jgi:hypothetical protein